MCGTCWKAGKILALEEEVNKLKNERKELEDKIQAFHRNIDDPGRVI